MRNRTAITLAILTVLFCSSAMVAGKPLTVYILAGQSNMVGVGGISTFDYIGDDPATAPMLKQMRGPDGKPRVCERVWISYLNGRRNQYGGEGFGKLTAGYGLRDKGKHSEPWDYIGPEFMFGITMEKHYDGPILIIKTAWGGQDLSTDFRPPSAGAYKLNDWQKEFYAKTGQTEKRLASIKENCHRNYRYMLEHVKKVLSDIKHVYPDYDSKQGYELSGFLWFQGWNDYVNTHTYLPEYGERQYDLYSDLLAQFIRDVRKDLDAPKMSFVIGVMGVSGFFTPGTFDTRGNPQMRMKRFRRAMAAPAELPEFKGNVVAVQTAPFWDDKLATIAIKQLKVGQMRSHLENKHKNYPNEDGTMTDKEQKEYLAKYRAELISPQEEALWKRGASIGGSVHYFGAAKFYAQAGKAFAEALLAMEKK